VGGLETVTILIIILSAVIGTFLCRAIVNKVYGPTKRALKKKPDYELIAKLDDEIFGNGGTVTDIDGLPGWYWKVTLHDGSHFNLGLYDETDRRRDSAKVELHVIRYDSYGYPRRPGARKTIEQVEKEIQQVMKQKTAEKLDAIRHTAAMEALEKRYDGRRVELTK
jgi:hypothetical protein